MNEKLKKSLAEGLELVKKGESYYSASKKVGLKYASQLRSFCIKHNVMSTKAKTAKKNKAISNKENTKK